MGGVSATQRGIDGLDPVFFEPDHSHQPFHRDCNQRPVVRFILQNIFYKKKLILTVTYSYFHFFAYI